MEKETKNTAKLFGLLGKNISYSFSKNYFQEKFKNENIHNHEYSNFDIQNLSTLKEVLAKHPNLLGFNITIPYKEEIITLLNSIDKTAKEIGAVNTVKITPEGLIGFNTDAFGFNQALSPLLKKHHKKALILGTGGASKAVAYVLKEYHGIAYKFVSRTPNNTQYSYTDLNQKILTEYTIIINCTPLGTFPDISAKPNIPYDFCTNQHLLFDLIYNPEKTAFLLEGEKKGAIIKNGYEMLIQQAEKAWEIWNP